MVTNIIIYTCRRLFGSLVMAFKIFIILETIFKFKLWWKAHVPNGRLLQNIDNPNVQKYDRRRLIQECLPPNFDSVNIPAMIRRPLICKYFKIG